jgi:uncharacterized NAD(P)/FAD-binding protein YdhS
LNARGARSDHPSDDLRRHRHAGRTSNAAAAHPEILIGAAFWEIIAIPDIRNQCAARATQLIENREAARVREDDQVPAL